MMITIDDLFRNPKSKYLSFMQRGVFDFNRNAPIISGGYREQMPSCITCASLDLLGFAGLAHIGPYENGPSYANSMYDVYNQRNQLDGLSFIAAGTNLEHLDQLASFLRTKRGLKVNSLYLEPNPSGVIDMGIDPESRKLIIYRSFDKKTLEVNF